MARHSFFESLESRTLMSITPATLTSDEQALSNALTTYSNDQKTWAALEAADKAAVKANKVGSDPAVEPLINAWKQAILTRGTTLATDQYNLTVASNADNIAILQDRQDVHNDKKDGNTTQLGLDQTALNAAIVKLRTDRQTFVDTLENDRITTKATIASDHEAILAKRLADGANPAGVAARQKLVSDSIMWVDTLAVDRKTIVTDRLAVAKDKHG